MQNDVKSYRNDNSISSLSNHSKNKSWINTMSWIRLLFQQKWLCHWNSESEYLGVFKLWKNVGCLFYTCQPTHLHIILLVCFLILKISKLVLFAERKLILSSGIKESLQFLLNNNTTIQGPHVNFFRSSSVSSRSRLLPLIQLKLLPAK